MSGTGTADDPFVGFSAEQAAKHWTNGGGSTVYVDMASHMSSGGGRIFSVDDFADTFKSLTSGMPPGTVVHFETNKLIRIETGAKSATVKKSYYSIDGILSDEAYVWGSTSAGFRGTVTVLENGNVAIDGQIRPFDEQFDFTKNTSNPFLESVRYVGKLLAGPGTPYEIIFVGDQGLLVSGFYQFQGIRHPRSGPTGHFHLVPIDHCFLAGTQVSMWDGTKKQIEQIEAGDIVVSYDKDGNLKPGRVKRTMTNRAAQILDVHGLMVTPGHATLCGDGRFDGQHVPILDILRSDGALVLEDGSKMRAGTGCRLGTMGDRLITAIIGEQQPDGLVRIAEVGQIRAGTRFIREDGEDVSVLDMILTSGGRLTEDGMIQTSTNGPKMPFRWTFTPSLPKPEDYVLQRSATHLQDIYQANEFEAIRPSIPIRTGSEAGATASKHPAIVAAAPVNVPLALRNRPDAPQVSRKYYRAAEAKARKKRTMVH